MLTTLNSQKQKKFIFFLLGLFLVSFLITIVGKNFTLWPQVRDYYFTTTPNGVLVERPRSESTTSINQDFSFQESFKYKQYIAKYSHYPRLMLVYPTAKIHTLTQQDGNLIFTYFCCLLITFFALLSAQTQCLLEKKEDNFPYYFFGTLGLFIILSLSMNGRLLYSFFGGACLLYGQTHWMVKKKPFYLIIFSLIAIILNNVSGGTFLVTLGACFLFVTASQKLIKYFGILLILFTPLGCMYVLKNFLYFNSIWGLLTHGYGKIIVDMYEYNKILGIVCLNIFMCFICILFLYMRDLSKKYPQFSPFLIYTYVAIIFGVFGWSTLAVILSTPLILGPYAIIQWIKHNKYNLVHNEKLFKP